MHASRITVAIILHNLIIDVEGSKGGEDFLGIHGQAEEEEDRDLHNPANEDEREQEEAGEEKRNQLKLELLAY